MFVVRGLDNVLPSGSVPFLLRRDMREIFSHVKSSLFCFRSG